MKIVFVHLGTAKVDHLWVNLKRLSVLFPDLDIVLITDNMDFPKKIMRLKVQHYHFNREKYSGKLLGDLSHNLEFRSGFWRFSIERFLALAAWHLDNQNDTFIHFESDVLLLPNFPFKAFDEISQLSWLSYNKESDLAAIFFSPNSRETLWLADEVVDRISADSHLTDMRVLNHISSSNPARVFILPSLRLDNILPGFHLKFSKKEIANTKASQFQGVFDGAALGMWLTGEDPRNHTGKIVRYIRHSSSIIDPSKFVYSVNSKSELTATFDGNSFSIFNLHIHSKELKFFGKRWRSTLRKSVEESWTFANPEKYSFRTLFIMIKDFKSRNGIFSIKNLKRILNLRN